MVNKLNKAVAKRRNNNEFDRNKFNFFRQKWQ